MKRVGIVLAALLVLTSASATLAAPVRIVVTPATVPAGGVVVVRADQSPCRVGGQVTVISAAFPGNAFGGQGAVVGYVGHGGSFAVRAHVRASLASGVYVVTVRCGGGNLGVSGSFRVVARRSAVAVYFVRGEHLAPVRRVVAGIAPARASLAALLAGPTASEQRQGYTSAVPTGTVLRSVSLARGVLTVDLSGRFQRGGGSASMLLRVAQVVHTATAFPTVQRVAFRLDGEPVAAIGGEGVVVRPPVGRSAFEAQAPPILVEQPLPGDRVTTALRIRGTANVFEAQFSVDVVTANGARLVHRAVAASAGSGSRGSFDVTVPLAAASRQLVVVAYDRSPRNGARIDVVRVPVTQRSR